MCITRLLLLCLSLLGLPVFAVTVPGLYQVREPIASQQSDERDAGLVHALRVLVVRLTGQSQAVQNPGLAGYFKRPQQLISQYAFDDGPPLTLVVDFDPTATADALRAAGLPTWGANRPLVLAWWLNENSEGSNLVGDNQLFATVLKRAAQNRGLPLLLPLADLNEQLIGTVENLTATQPGALRRASERYSANALLVVDAKETSGKWQAQWRLWIDDSREQGQVEGDNPDAVADAVLLAVSSRMSTRFVTVPGTTTDLITQVQGATLARYAELQRLLNTFSARLVVVRGDRLDYSVKASPAQLRAQLGLVPLQEVPVSVPQQPENRSTAPSVSVSGQNSLSFRWP